MKIHEGYTNHYSNNFGWFLNANGCCWFLTLKWTLNVLLISTISNNTVTSNFKLLWFWFNLKLKRLNESKLVFLWKYWVNTYHFYNRLGFSCNNDVVVFDVVVNTEMYHFLIYMTPELNNKKRQIRNYTYLFRNSVSCYCYVNAMVVNLEMYTSI